MAYKKCPRCNLNYIKDVDAYCVVCLGDLGKTPRVGTDEEEYDICPECGDDVIKAGEDMCAQCLQERSKDPIDENVKKSNDWVEFVPGVEPTDTFRVDIEDEMEELEKVEIEEAHEDDELITDKDDE